MAKEYRYKFQKGSKKSLCPGCNQKTFVQHIDSNTGELLPDQYGRCDSESKCAYHLNPYKDGYSKMIFEKERGDHSGNWKPQRLIPRPKPAPKVEPVFIPVEVFNHTRQGYEQNVFVQNLLSCVTFPFEVRAIEQVISHYNLGTVCNGYRAGAITFPFIDINGNVRAIQVKQFDQANHTTGTDFLHSIIEKHHSKRNEPLPGWLEAYKGNDKKVSCLFGEHLLNSYPLNPIALVEAPKTAVYCSLYFGFPEQPESLLWLAVYNLSSLNFDKCKALQGKDVYLFPDLSKGGKAFELWSNKAKELSNLMPGTRFEVSDLLETLAPNELREQGADIADVLIKMDWRNFRHKQPTPEPQAETLPTLKSEKGENSEALKQTYFLQPELLPALKGEKGEKYVAPKQTYFSQPKTLPTWEQDITELENYFTGITLPTQPVKLNQCSIVTNVSLFLESHFATLKNYNGNKTFLPYLNRLQEMKQVLTTNPN